MKREADAGAMTGSGGPTSPHKRYRQGDDELRLLIPSKQVQRRESRRITRKGEVSRGESETQLARIGRVWDAMSMLYMYACMEIVCTGWATKKDSMVAGSIIGKGGQNITKLRNQLKSRISIVR
uniref:K Homology domain-containing protein n=1 Tax=Vespula pensylvanica TaxID=30213 RepID=A0A834UAM4_VESPE|nr:hypothetical protein H0235_008346 [Vespula pensylvanica]